MNALRQFGCLTGLDSPQGIAVDTLNDQIIVANSRNDSITGYGRTDSGDTAPIMTIAGPSTGLDSPWGIALQ